MPPAAANPAAPANSSFRRDTRRRSRHLHAPGLSGTGRGSHCAARRSPLIRRRWPSCRADPAVVADSTMRSASDSASSTSWVTSTTVTPSWRRGRQPSLQIGPGGGVQRAERFIEQQQLRAGRDCAQDRHPLRLPAGEFVGITAGQGVEPESADQPVGVWMSSNPPRCAANRRAKRHSRPRSATASAVAAERPPRFGVGCRRTDQVRVPASRVSSPAQIRNSVDLPLPLRPSTARNSPVRDLSGRYLRSADTAPNCLVPFAYSYSVSSHRSCPSEGDWTGRNAASRNRRLAALPRA